jgi:hypothetical protein
MEYSDIRKAFYNQLNTEITEVTAVRSGWVPKADIDKPYLVVEFAGELPSINTHVGIWMQIDVLIVGMEGDFLTMDDIADHVVRVLHKVDITTEAGRIIRPEYKRDSRVDYWSEDLNASVIRVRFWLPTDFWT